MRAHPVSLKKTLERSDMFGFSDKDEAFLNSLRFLIGDTFSTTVNGSQERADYLANLELMRVKAALVENRVGLLKSKRILRKIRPEIEREKQQVLF